jgi:hypothetical protein
MSTTENVRLAVRPGASNGQGWENTQGSNGAPYSFKYQGGHANTGGLRTSRGEGAATLNLSLDSDDRYTISDVQFRDDTQQQLSWRKMTAVTGAITFANTQDETAYYTVNVIDAQGDIVVPCDPMISNEPKNR